MQNSRTFDLNVEEVLEHWETADAIRELIANALDEQKLSGSQEIQLYKDRQGWHIRDFGRGLHYRHLTQNESPEKLQRPNLVIGKFGVGLKDALATLHRRGVVVLIRSCHGDFSLGVAAKAGFDDISTLHALVAEPTAPAIVGTDVILKRVLGDDIEKAKDFFLHFTGQEVLENTRYGQVLRNGKSGSRIYVNGVRVAVEVNFHFSYNITSLTKVMRRALNRERTHVARSAYGDRVKDILLMCKSGAVAELLVEDLGNLQIGSAHEEVKKWLDVAVHACKLLNALSKVLFVAAFELQNGADLIEYARSDGYRIVVVNESFEYSFIAEDELKAREREVFRRTGDILRLVGGKPPQVRKIMISETMRLDRLQEVVGLWEADMRRIIIKRSQLRSLRDYAGTLLHEVGHARNGAQDLSRDFEDMLTRLLGEGSVTALK